jgi:hypothetical protein
MEQLQRRAYQRISRKTVTELQRDVSTVKVAGQYLLPPNMATEYFTTPKFKHYEAQRLPEETVLLKGTIFKGGCR